MTNEIIACNNDTCLKRETCQRYKLFKEGAKKFHTNGGTPDKGCRKYLKTEN